MCLVYAWLNSQFKSKKGLLDWGSIRSSPDRERNGRPTFGPSCTELVYLGYWHFDNGATSKVDDVLLDHGGLPHVLPLAVQLEFFGQVWGTIPRCSYSLSFVVRPLLHAQK